VERGLLLLGILVRLATFAALGPLNNDKAHFVNVVYIARHAALPPSDLDSQAYHPPLYYLLAAPIWVATHSLKAVQALSLALSIGTLVLLYDLICRRRLVADEGARRYALLLACFLPQLVMFGLYVSNDSLAIFLGVLAALQAWRLAETPGRRELGLLVLVAGLGLLTKATFLAFLPVLGGLVAVVWRRAGAGLGRAVGVGLLAVVLAFTVGSYKFVENAVNFGRPLLNNLDLDYPTLGLQRLSYQGARSFLNVNLLRLLAWPTVSEATRPAYPLLLYGTFWYQHIPESSFTWGTRPPANRLGSAIYLVALVPTAVFGLGLARLVREAPRALTTADPRRADDARRLALYAAVAFLLVNAAMLLGTVAKYHIWSVMQGRLLFPSAVGLLGAFAVGAAALRESRAATALLGTAVWTLVVLFVLYLAGEIGATLA
jgi:hypothetical protein